MNFLAGVDGGSDFERQLLSDIYHSIKNDEIVMPAEQTGLVKENYLWKVLLKRGTLPEGRWVTSTKQTLIFPSTIHTT